MLEKIGDTNWNRNKRVQETWKLCPDCKKGYWCPDNKKYSSCKTCGTKVGKTYTNNRGHIYIKLAKEDPHFEMTVKLSLMGEGWVRVARYLMAKQVGRCLTEDEQVWHKDGDKGNNELDNLVIMRSRYAHRLKPNLDQEPENTYEEVEILQG